jgi:hypothetical protein
VAALGARAGDCLVVTGGPQPPGAAGSVRPSTYDTASIVAAGRKLARGRPVERVVSFAETDVLAASTLRAELGLPGQQPTSAAAYRDKALMREYTTGAGLPGPRWWRVEDASQVREHVATHGLPLVLKPRSSSGSVGVRILRGPADVDRLPAELPGHVLEEFVDGTVVHVDGLMVAGRPLFALPAVYTDLGCLAHLADHGSGSHLLPMGHRWFEPLVTELWRVVAALPSAPNLVLHAEFFVRDDHRPVLCEIASRLPGHPIPPMIDRALGVDLRSEWLRLEVGLPVDVDALAAAAATAPPVANYGLPPRRGTLVALPSAAPPEYSSWIHDLDVLARSGETWDKERYAARKSGDFVLTWTVSAPDSDSLASRMERSAEALAGSVRWE